MSRFVAALLVAALLVPLVGAPASARPLGGLQLATMFVQNGAATFADPSWALASFDGPDGATVTTGTALEIGGTWTRSNGSFVLLTNRLRTSSSAARTYLYVDLGAGRSNVQLVVDVVLGSTASGRRGGLVLRGASAGYLRVMFRNSGSAGSLELSKVVGTTVTVLRTVTLAGSTMPTSGRLRVRAVGSSIEAFFGVATTPQLAHTLAGADATTFASRTWVGVTTDGDTSTYLDSFRAVAP